MKIIRFIPLLSIIGFLGFVSSIQAMTRTQGWCEQGNQSIKVLGYTSSSTTPVQASYPGCTVSVFVTSGASGFVDVTGTSVLGVGGTPFNPNGQWVGLTIKINSVNYTIASVLSTTSLTLTSSAGTQAGVAYSIVSAPAAIYADNNNTPLANPFTADTRGFWFFYAPNGRVDVTLSGGGILTPFTLSDIIVNDPLLPPYPTVLDIRTFGVVGNGVRSQGSISSGSPVLTDPNGKFTPADVGKQIYVKGAGSAGIDSNDLYTTIGSYASAGQVTLAASATTTVIGAYYGYGTDDAPAIRNAFAALKANGGGTLVFPVAATYFLGTPGPTYFESSFSIDIISSNINVDMADGAVLLQGFDGGVISLNRSTRDQWTEVLSGLSGCFPGKPTLYGGNCAVVYSITPLANPGSLTITVSPANVVNFKVGDFILIRTGYVLPTCVNEDIPDAEINQVSAVNSTTGVISLRWKTIKPYVQQQYPVDASCGSFSGVNAPFGVTNITPMIVTNIGFTNLQLISDFDHSTTEGGEAYGVFFSRGNIKSILNFHDMNFIRYERIDSMNIFLDVARSLQAPLTSGATSHWLAVATGTSDAVFSHNYLESTGNSYVHVHEGASLKLLYNTIKPAAPVNPSIQTTVSIRARSYETEIAGNTIYGVFGWSIYVDPTCTTGGSIVDNIVLNTSIAPGGAIINIAGSGGWFVNNNTGAGLLGGITTFNSVTPNFGTNGPLAFLDTDYQILFNNKLNWTNGFLGVGTATPALPLDLRYSLAGASVFGQIIKNLDTTSGNNSGLILDTANSIATNNQVVGLLLEHNAAPDFFISNGTNGTFDIHDYLNAKSLLGEVPGTGGLKGDLLFERAINVGQVTFLQLSTIIPQGPGTIVGCSNCDTPSSIGVACTAAGDHAGAEAHYIRGVWRCF